MPTLALIVASLFVLYVGLVGPLLSRKRYQEFSREVAAHPALRSRFYLRTLFVHWIWIAVIGIILLLGSTLPSTLGLRAPDDWTYTFLLLAETLVLLPLAVVVVVRRIAKTRRPGLAMLLLEVKELLPHTASERRLWLLLSVSAGIYEEIFFRGFLPWYFLVLGTFFRLQVSLLTAFVFSTILFGFAHIYQGWKGVLGTALVGAVLAYLYVTTSSLFLPVVFHILIDARVVFFAPAILSLDRPAEA